MPRTQMKEGSRETAVQQAGKETSPDWCRIHIPAGKMGTGTVEKFLVDWKVFTRWQKSYMVGSQRLHLNQ